MQRRIVIAARSRAAGAALRRALSAAGFAVGSEWSAAGDAVDAAAREHPDVCVIDAGLPGGALVAAAAIASPPVPADVILVGDGGDAESRAAELVGAAYVARGSDERLTDTVAALLRRRRDRRKR